MKPRPIHCTLALAGSLSAGELSYPLVDSGQLSFYDNARAIAPPAPGAPFHGQDACYSGNQPAYRDNGDGTVSDLVTGLMWQQDPGGKMSWKDAMTGASKFRLAGHDDWRLPTIKELYSLILFSGLDPDPMASSTGSLRPFINADVFKFRYGDPARGERIIDSQFATSTKYVSTTMRGNETMFGVNFADGRIKGYPTSMTRGRREKTYHVLYVRGNPGYGQNDFKDNGDRTVTDRATGLTWMKIDSGHLKAGNKDFPYYWSGSTHARGRGGAAAAYFAFGRSPGWMRSPRAPNSDPNFLDVHGAGSQRSDPKTGDASRFPHGRGPQGDVIRILNHVRCVRGGKADPCSVAEVVRLRAEPTPPRPPAPASPENAAPTNQRINPHFLHLDLDKDGKLSRAEFDGPPRAFGHLDHDSDGFLTPEEFPKGPPR